MITPSFGLTATERVLPKLALNFTTATLDPRITFTRSGATATRVNSSGYIETVAADTPRFDFDPATLACKGLLIEDAKANIFTYSNDFRDTAAAGSARPWNYTLVTTTQNVAVSPDNTTNASKLISTASSGFHAMSIFSGTRIASAPYTFTFYAKAAEIGFCYPNFSSALTGSGIGGLVNLSTGEVTGVAAGLTLTTTNAGNGWWRITATATGNSSTTTFNSVINTTNAAGVLSHTGNGVDGIYIYGAQLEQGAFATSYIPTTTTSLTRNADVATMTGTNFSDWFNATEGALYSECSLISVVSANVFVVSDNTVNNRLYIATTSTGLPHLRAFVAGADQGLVNAAGGASVSANTIFKMVGSYKVDSACFSRSGLGVGTDNTYAIPTVDRAYLGSGAAGTAQMNGHIQKIMYWPQRLINAEVQAFSK
jgi:hypothetical protein